MARTEIFRFNDTLVEAITNQDSALANEVERRLEHWFDRTPRFAVCSLASAQTITASTNTSVALDTDDFDPEDWHSLTTNTHRIIAPVKGWYRVTLNVAWQGGLSSADRIIARVLNTSSAQITADDRSAGATATPDQSISTLTQLDADGYVFAQVYHTSAASRDVKITMSLELVDQLVD